MPLFSVTPKGLDARSAKIVVTDNPHSLTHEEFNIAPSQDQACASFSEANMHEMMQQFNKCRQVFITNVKKVPALAACYNPGNPEHCNALAQIVWQGITMQEESQTNLYTAKSNPFMQMATKMTTTMKSALSSLKQHQSHICVPTYETTLQNYLAVTGQLSLWQQLQSSSSKAAKAGLLASGKTHQRYGGL